MILTKDNLLRYVQEQKYVLPTTIANQFETTTMIASAALSELAKDNSLGITHLKLSSSPYYYDIKQRESLQELAEKHLDGNELKVYQKLKEQQILPKSALSIPEQIAIDKIQDFAKKIELNFQEKTYEFWVWYLRDLNETKKQIQSYFSSSQGNNSQSQEKNTQNQKNNTKTNNNENKTSSNSSQYKPSQNQNQPNIPQQAKQNIQHLNNDNTNQNNNINQNQNTQPNQTQQNQNNSNNNQNNMPNIGIQKDEYEQAIENYLQKNYLHIESKQKNEKGIMYNLKLQLNSISIEIDCFYYEKKPQEAELINFYTSSIKPKIVFMKQAPKKFYKLTQELDNFEIINL